MVSESATPKEEVASAVGTADPEELLARTELAAIAARPIVALEPPTNAPAPPVMVIPLFTEREAVATDESAFAALP